MNNVVLFKLLKINILLFVLIRGILYEHEQNTVDIMVGIKYV